MSVRRKTTVKQVLNIEVDLGPLPPEAHLSKIRVIRKIDGREMWLNERDWGKGKFKPTHYKVLEDYDPGLDPRNQPVVLEIDSQYTAEDLTVMRTDELRKVPEFTRIPPATRARLNTKQDYVDAILAQRKTVKSEAPTLEREAL